MDLRKVAAAYAAEKQLYGRGPATYLHRVEVWLRSGAKTANQFRKMMASRYSATTIERTLGSIDVLHRYAGVPFDLGEKLKMPKPRPNPPSVQVIGLLYERANVPCWPTWLPPPERADWWRGLLCVTLWTAFRFGDIERIAWSDITTQISLPASKTRKVHQIPITPIVQRHLDAIPRGGDTVFRFTKCRKQFNRELIRLCTAAEVDRVGMQKLRQAAVMLWTTTDAKAGEIIHGCGIRGSLAHYLSCAGILQNVAPRVRLPDQFHTDDERNAAQDEEAELIDRYRKAPSEIRQHLMTTARLTG